MSSDIYIDVNALTIALIEVVNEQKDMSVKWIFFTKLNCFIKCSPPPPEAVTNVLGGNLQVMLFIEELRHVCNQMVEVERT